MSILDELKKQADALKADQSAAEQAQAEREAFYRTDILPRLEYIYSWLFELTEHLNLIKPDIKARYELEQLGELPELKQGSYRIAVDSRRDMTKLVLGLECVAEGKLTQIIEGKRNIEQYVEYLRGTKIQFDRRDQMANASDLREAAFDIELRVPVTFSFVANIELGCIDMRIRNFDHLGLRQFQVKPGDVTEAFMDNIGRYLMRQREDFYKLDISDDERERIRLRVREEQAQRDRELNELDARERAEQTLKEVSRPGLLDSLKQLARRREE